MAVTSFQDLPLADREREWDGSAAEKRVRAWAGAEDESNQKFRDAHVWSDGEKKDNFTAYKLLIADVIEGNWWPCPAACSLRPPWCKAPVAAPICPRETSTGQESPEQVLRQAGRHRHLGPLTNRQEIPYRRDVPAIPGGDVSHPSMTLAAVVLDAPNARELCAFYRQLLGWAVKEDEPDWVMLKSPDGGAGLPFQTEKNFQRPVWPAGPRDQQMQTHLDILVDDLEEAARHAREVGAVQADYQPQEDGVRVFLDPAGHPFCLFLPGF